MPAGKLHSASVSRLGHSTYALVSNEDDSIHGGLGSNQGFVILENSVLIFDTGFSTRHARILDHAISKVTSKKPRYVINSHDHSDHVFGNSYFAKKYGDQGIEIISHTSCMNQLLKLGHKRLKEYRQLNLGLERLLQHVRITLPELTYRNAGLSLNLEGTDIVFIHPENGAHTLGDTVLAMPGEGVMFMGDILFNEYFPNLEDADLEGWIDFLEDIDFQTYSRFLPGHGRICKKEAVIDFTDYLRTVRGRLLDREQTPTEQSLMSCFETEKTATWKFRQVLEKNVTALTSSLRGQLGSSKVSNRFERK